MAKRKAVKKVNAVEEEIGAKPVRLDLLPKDHERLERVAKRRGLSKAAFARMIVLERLNLEDPQA